MKRSFLLLSFLFSLLFLNAQKLAVVPYVSGLGYPIDVKNCGDDRLFVADKSGIIRIINEDGTVRPVPFLDISSKMVDGYEDGLMGIAFSPNYKTDRKFYVDYVGKISDDTTSFVEEYKVNSGDSNIADPSSSLTILTQPQPFNDHVGGNLMFGKDGYLYINFGDGDAEEDPNKFAQNLNTFNGKVLRIDVSNSSLMQPYVIPPTNAFYSNSEPNIKKEIWAYGLRNPFRSSIDRLTGDIWIADVGQYYHEEINFQAVDERNGQNYGWNIMEGDSCFLSTTCNSTGLKLPIYDYGHTNGSGAVIGGYVFRSAQSKSLFGTYLFADLTSKWIDGMKENNGVLSGQPVEYLSGTQAFGYPISFGEDRYGDQYIIYNANGTLYKLSDTSYLRHPKAYITSVEQSGGDSYLLQGLQGRNLTYQWLRNNVIIPGATFANYDVNSSGNYSLVVTNDLGFSDTSDVFSFGALPLNFISFTAHETSLGKINLQWKTSSEQNVKGYNVFRKQGSETNFSGVGFVASKSVNGNSNNELDYSFIDSSVLINSKIFYRLQIENKDGRHTYSDIISISSSKEKNNFSVYPNPAKRQFTVYIDKFTQPLMMSIYDNSGQKIKEQLLNQQNTTVKVTGIKGIYIVQISNTDGSNIERKKLLVE
jgi:hypothetical protein